MTYEEMKNNEEVNALLEKGNRNLGVLGFTDHSMAHCALVAERALIAFSMVDFPEPLGPISVRDFRRY